MDIVDFKDDECTCICGNKHEVYGGQGYTMTKCEGVAGGLSGKGYYHREVKCKVCNKIHVYKKVN